MSILIIPQTSKFTEEYLFNLDEENKTLEYLPINSPVIITIGKNNSRKSRFLRSLLTEDKYLITNDSVINKLIAIRKYLNRLATEIDKSYLEIKILNSQYKSFSSTKYDLSDFNNLLEYISNNKNLNRVLNKDYIQSTITSITQCLSVFDEKYFDNLDQQLKFISLFLKAVILFFDLINKGTNIGNNIEFHYRGRQVHKRVEFQNTDSELCDIINEYLIISKSIINPNKIYIPTLRGSIILVNEIDESGHVKVNMAAYENTIRINYKIDKNITVFTGLNLYYKIKQSRNSRREIRKDFESFENFLKENFFSGNQVDIVSLEDENIIHVFIEGEPDRELFNLGDGIQSLIMLLYPIFTAPKESWLFIEEPELNLHPGLQSLFLSTLLNDKTIVDKNLKFFITTHSNHLLDTILINESKCSIYSFTKTPNDEYNLKNKSIIKEEVSPDATLLNMIGVHNSSVLLSNVTIWVEGITDRKYIKAFLDSYSKYSELPLFVEGYHYSFIEYAGSNLKHYLFESEEGENMEYIKSKFLSNRIFLIADKDLDKDKKHRKYEKIQSETFKYSHTGGIEIENTLSPHVINLILRNILNINQDFNINVSDYDQYKFGQFLEELIKSSKQKNPKLKSDSGSLTTYYKNMFADYIFSQAESNHITWLQFKENSHAESLTMKIFQFIKDHNSIQTN